MNAVRRSLFAFARLAVSLHLILPVIAHGIDWNEFRVAPGQVAIPEDLEDFTLIGISADASVVAGNEVGDWNQFPNSGPTRYRHQYPFYWTTGMEQIQEIAPNTDEIITFPRGYKGRVTRISADGNWVIGEYVIAGDEFGFHQAFLYSIESDVFEYLGDFGWSEVGAMFSSKDPNVYYLASVATGISGDGSVVVGWARNPGGRQRAFRWTREEGMVQVFDEMIGIWDDDPENWMLAISDDGTRSVAGSSRLREPNGTERISMLFALDDFKVSASFPMPNTFSLLDVAEASGPDNSVLLTIRSELDPLPVPGRLGPDFESIGVRWFPLEDRYEAYSEFTYSRALSALSQTDDGNLMTFLMTGIAPADGFTNYGLLWTPQAGLFDATDFLANTYEVDFGHDAVAKILPSRDGSMLVAEVYTTSNHFRKALARFDLSEETAPMARLFPGSRYDDGWRLTPMGSFHTRDYPWVWWRNMGWIFINGSASSAKQVWFWQKDLGWCSCAGGSWISGVYFYSMQEAEWIYAVPSQGWLHSASRSWFRLIN